MSQTSTLKGQCIAEFLGTGLLIFSVWVVSLRLKLPELLLDSGKSASSGVWGSDGYLPDGRCFWRTPEPGSDHRTLAICLFRQT